MIRKEYTIIMQMYVTDSRWRGRPYKVHTYVYPFSESLAESHGGVNTQLSARDTKIGMKFSVYYALLKFILNFIWYLL